MADIGNSVWDETDANNTTAAPDGAPEGMAPSGVNNTLRAHQGAIKRWYDWTIPKTTGGTSTAYTLSYTVAPGALVDGMTHLVRFNATNGVSATLNVNGLGAKPLYSYQGSWAVVPVGNLPTDFISEVSYNASAGAYFVLGAVQASATTTFFGGDTGITVAGTFTNGPSTGAIGASGQVWIISGTITLLNNSAGNDLFTAQLHDGTNAIASGSLSVITLGYGSISLSAVVTLSAATTFFLRATDTVGGSSGVIKTSSPTGTVSKATCITAVRLA